jgi:multiple sugar transport system substrate-binding protein
MKDFKLLNTLALGFIFLVSACSQTPEPLSSPEPTTAAIAIDTPEPAISTTEIPAGPLTLSIWVPPQFDPQSGSSAADLFQARLDEFTSQNPDIHINVRVKAEEGPGGLLTTLTAAHAAAPLALPDIIALSQHDLETAAIKNLIFPIDENTAALNSEDWYEYALQLIRVQESNFGFPFAGDGLIFVYRPSEVQEPPLSLEAALDMNEALSFPANSGESLFTLGLYLLSGGQIEDDAGRPILDPAPLESILTFYQSGLQSGLTPFWLTQFETFAQSYEAFLDGQAQMAIAWVTEYLENPNTDLAVSSLPSPGNSGGTLATGWIWALTSQDPERQRASIQLAEFLVDPEFLGSWTAAAGVLPTRPSSLEQWPASPLADFVSAIAESARAVPPKNLLSILGPVLQGSTIDVLKQLAEPGAAAQEAAEQLTGS